MNCQPGAHNTVTQHVVWKLEVIRIRGEYQFNRTVAELSKVKGLGWDKMIQI